jgi:gliding motility associated protien GldN
MKNKIAAILLLSGAMTYAQPTELPILNDPLPNNDITERKLFKERRLLPYDDIREADIVWQKTIWRVVDIREKQNLPFANPEMPFFSLINEAAKTGELSAYSVEDDKFSKRLSPDEVRQKCVTIDTVVVFDENTYEESIKIVENELNPEHVKQFRIKEMWYFDKETSTLKVRILGIAPLMEEYDNNGNYRFTRPMYWVYYPNCRTFLAHHQVYNLTTNEAAPISWEELFEMRYFSSYITKESNVYDRRIEDYLTGIDALLEGDKIHHEIFNYEHDLWSY